MPPAWTDVWIAPGDDCHLQATGKDARGRKQYRYHDRWTACRDEVKYANLIDFARALPRLRAAVEADLGRRGLGREKVVATVVWLLDTTLIRVGNAAYARDNKSFGLTTFRDRHVRVEGSSLRFRFTRKSGKEWMLKVSDRRIAPHLQGRAAAWPATSSATTVLSPEASDARVRRSALPALMLLRSARRLRRHPGSPTALPRGAAAPGRNRCSGSGEGAFRQPRPEEEVDAIAAAGPTPRRSGSILVVVAARASSTLSSCES